MKVFVCLTHGRFLIAISSTTPTMATAMIIAIPMANMYMSVGGCAAIGCGDAVATASLAWKAAEAEEP